MAYRLLTLVLTVALAAASIMTQSGSALAQKTDPTTDFKNLNTSRSNVDRMGGGGGGKGAAGIAVSDPGVPGDPPVKKPKTKTK